MLLEEIMYTLLFNITHWQCMTAKVLSITQPYLSVSVHPDDGESCYWEYFLTERFHYGAVRDNAAVKVSRYLHICSLSVKELLFCCHMHYGRERLLLLAIIKCCM